MEYMHSENCRIYSGRGHGSEFGGVIYKKEYKYAASTMQEKALKGEETAN
jgi:hypothetical protein